MSGGGQAHFDCHCFLCQVDGMTVKACKLGPSTAAQWLLTLDRWLGLSEAEFMHLCIEKLRYPSQGATVKIE